MSIFSACKDIGYSLVRLLPVPRNSAVILIYHSISGAKHFGAVVPENFEQQMLALKNGGFNVVSLGTLATYRTSGTIPPNTVCITFDDGYLDNYTVAYPILKKLSLPATIFVITSSIGGTLDMRGETFAMMSEAQILELSDSGLISVEPHTVSHSKLHQLSTSEAEREVRVSKEAIESITGKPCHHFAYPKGRYNDESRAAVARSGIPYAYTTEEGFIRVSEDDLMLHRNGINRTVTFAQFRGIVHWGRLSRERLFRL